MDEIEELLPGLEEFLTITLASENLSHFAEERRQFFIERLDIVKLPPTLPPREGRVLPPELLKETEQSSGVPTSHSTPDFAATQREISRSLVESSPCGDDVPDGAEASPVKVVKLYDDIDPTDSAVEQVSVTKNRPLSDIKPDKTSDDDSEENEENALYEIPVARQQMSAESNSHSFGADGSSMATVGSIEELPDDVLDTTLLALSPIPPPLPPRRDIKLSDSGSRNSINFDDKPPELPFRPPLPKRNELNTRSDKSDRSEKSNNSDPELSADGDSTSYESFDEEEQHDADLMNKLSVQLPKKAKKRMALKKSKKLSRSRSSSQWEISVPFRKLENIDISGELYYKGKLRWNRRIVAISNGCLAMYKPDKDARPSLVIPLTGYEASILEKEGRKGFELKIVHPNADCHSFSVDFKDWAALWMEHINGCSRGEPPAKYHTHLARTFSGDIECVNSGTTSGSKLNVSGDNSAELEYDEIEIACNLRDDLSIKKEDDCDSVKSSPVESLSNTMLRKPVSRHFQSEKSPLHSKRRTLPRATKSNPFGLSSKDRTISATVKDILRRRQRAMYTIQSSEPGEQVGKYTPTADRPNSQTGQVSQDQQVPQSVTLPASALTLSRWDWKGVFYNWSLPLDQLILAFRRTDLTGSTSNLSTGSEGGSEDSLRSKIKGNKVMRMGSFAFRATQFFENIGKGTKNKRKSQTTGAAFRHSGDFTGVPDGILEEPPASTSMGNLVRNRANATSDSNLHSSFMNSEKMFSLPPAARVTHASSHHWEGAEEEVTDFVDVTHKGYLHIFSSFNKRRWGKRWCVVRENMFECYKSASSKQCELNFLLKACQLRRAIAETNSERGLMILESDREKITVEPLSKEEMGLWVRVLLIETSTPNVPEGLEEFVKDSNGSDGDSSSVISFTVLKQWDMDCLVPTKNPGIGDYSEPVEAANDVAKQPTINHPESETAFHSAAVSNSCSDPMSQSASISADTVNKTSDDLTVYPKNKHATDSGFYSVKGANSDTDSSHEGAELDYAFAAPDSGCFFNSQHTRSFSKGSSPSSPFSVQESELDKDLIHSDTPANCFHSNQLDLPASSSNCVQLSHSSTSLSFPSPSSHKLVTSTSESHLSELAAENCSYFGRNKDYCLVSPTNLNTSKGHSKSASAVSKSCKSASSSLAILSPNGEEYSVVLKRSERSSKSPESSGELNSSLSSASNSLSRTSSSVGYNKTHENEDLHIFNFADDCSDQRLYASVHSDNDSSYYEPICGLHSMADDTDHPSAYLIETQRDTSDSSQLPVLIIEIDDQPPPIPTSPIPDLITTPSFPIRVLSSAVNKNLETENPTWPQQPDLPSQCTENPTWPQHPDLPSQCTENPNSSKSNKGKGNKSLNLRTNNDDSLSDFPHKTLSNGDISTSGVHNCASGNAFLSCLNEPPLSPTSDTIATVIENPKSTPDELKKMKELLKWKQTEIKRKRLAVHDKHQRVSSDEERLACEKEIATLERVAETTDLDMRAIQNQLDTVRGQNMEAIKATPGKFKLLSKKRKAKKKS